MSFKTITEGTYADLLSNGKTYRVTCRRCGLLREATDKSQAQIETSHHNSTQSSCVPRSRRSARY
ncbi:hypothetical protein EAO70_06040 [Streptomyces sp. adm13(2018)]|nr:hypothetical protein EAO70_06040 [Streptomyces sp. adm13(2018)]